jgi:Glycosyltransferases involved in cell wall biogenesis
MDGMILTSDINLSVVMLCYGAGQRVYGLVEKTIKLLENNVPSWEIILVGNYFEKNQDDNTPDVVKDIASKDTRIKAVVLSKEGMMGWDARTGLRRATGRYICLIDGDEQAPSEDIIRVYEKIKDEGLDLVKPYRIIRHDGMARKILSFFYNLIFKMMFPGFHAQDINSKPKIMTRQAYEKMCLESNDWFLDAEMMIQVRRLKLRVGEIPTNFYKCEYRQSFVRFGAIFEFVKNLIRYRIREFRG